MALITDFIYDGIRLSDLGYLIVSFDGAKDDEVDTDSQLSFNHLSLFNGKYQPFIKSQYEDPLEFEFWITNNVCTDTTMNISVSQMAQLKRWLCRPTPHKLQIPTEEYAGIYWTGSFVVEEYIFGDRRIGAHLTFECNAPFGYYNDVTLEGSLLGGEVLTYDDASDEVGFIYPDLEVVIGADGDLELEDKNGRKTIINNCKVNEVIRFNHLLSISSSDTTHKVGDDFNYVFYRISNNFSDKENSLISNLPIDYTITYKPIAKVVVV